MMEIKYIGKPLSFTEYSPVKNFAVASEAGRKTIDISPMRTVAMPSRMLSKSKSGQRLI